MQREPKAAGVGLYLFDDWVGTQAAVVELLCGLGCADVAGVEPDIFPNAEGGNGESVIVSSLFVCSYGDTQLLAQVRMEVAQLLSHLCCLATRYLLDVDLD